jgi:Helix-turn-helix domain
MAPYFFRVEHDLLRSESFKALGGSAIKVYLVIGLYSDFGTDWAYPSIRTIAAQAGLSRQTVLAAIGELTSRGLLATSKSKGRSTAYKVMRQAPPERPPAGSKGKDRRSTKAQMPQSEELTATGPLFLDETEETGPNFLDDPPSTGPNFWPVVAQSFGQRGPRDGPKQEPGTREDTSSIPIPGTPFRVSAEGRLLVAVDLQELLTNQGIPRRLAEKIATQKDPEAVAKVLLNALYLQSQGKLQNGPGYIRAGIEDGYDLLPQVADRLESRRRELETRLRTVATDRDRRRRDKALEEEEKAINLVISSLRPDELEALIERAVMTLPELIARRNPTLSNPFVRARVYELACGEPSS